MIADEARKWSEKSHEDLQISKYNEIMGIIMSAVRQGERGITICCDASFPEKYPGTIKMLRKDGYKIFRSELAAPYYYATW